MKNASRWGAASLVLMALVVYGVHSAGSYQEKAKLTSCKKNAISVGNKGFLGVCERSSGVEAISTVIYDSTDEIALPTSQRSAEWKAAARSLEKRAPFGISGIVAVMKKTDHYYRVDFQVTVDPDF